ncbi:hypothetical protein F5Y12DRAFT_518736 [Xylaria sp. FL1777]|nr:hypothetical protein F5Y12DRAFT_518736 [Xylaria sp. FL1777]
MAEPPSPLLLWAIVLLAGALLLALGVYLIITTSSAYNAAPLEVTTFIDTVDFSIEENENCHRDVAKVPRLEDKMRLNRLLREIQKQGDDLREHLNRLVVEDGGTTMRPGARVFWADHRKRLEERVHRLDMLRMRFMVVFMGAMTTAASERAKDAARTAPRTLEKVIPPAPPAPPTPPAPPAPPPPPPPAPDLTPRPGITKSYSESHPHKPLRRLTTHTMGHNEKTETPHRSGWFGVVAELQRSPILRQRHASIEAAMRSPPPLSPIGSPLAALRPSKGPPIPENLQL